MVVITSNPISGDLNIKYSTEIHATTKAITVPGYLRSSIISSCHIKHKNN